VLRRTLALAVGRYLQTQHCLCVDGDSDVLIIMSGITVSFRLHPVRRRFQPPPSPVVVILAACDPTYTAVHCRQSCVSCTWKLPLEQSAARCHLSSNADCFSKPPQNLSLFMIISFLTVFRFQFCTACLVVV